MATLRGMASREEDLRQVLEQVFTDSLPPRPLDLVLAIGLVREGALTVKEAATRFRTTAARLQGLLASKDVLKTLLGARIPDLTRDIDDRTRASLGQLIIGALAEAIFEEIYKETVGTSDLELRDDRRARGET
ncbi:MAG: hypothetical protein ACRD2L_16785, partial [Terriglobia bacterium]